MAKVITRIFEGAFILMLVWLLLTLSGCSGTGDGFGKLLEGAGKDIQAMCDSPYVPE